MKVAVVILNWNGKDLLQEFLPSVISHSKKARIYLSDNASKDDSVDYIKTVFPEISCIQLDRNYGYAGGYNRAIKEVSEELIVLLNSDVAVTDGWLDPFLEAFANDKQLAAAQPKILNYREPEYFEYAGAAGGFIDRLGLPFCRGRMMNTLEKDLGQYDDDIDIFWASGACLVVRKSSFEKAGGFDEDLFAHQEEIDLCWRMRYQGGKISYLHGSKVLHLGGGTLSSANPRKTYLNFRNTLLLLYKNVAGPKVYLILLIRMLMDGLAALYFLFGIRPGHFMAVFKAHVGFYRLIPLFRKKRKKWANQVKYYTIFSLVWTYFIRRNRYFSDVKKLPLK